MTPEEQRKLYPKFVADEMEKLRSDPIVNNPIHPTKITDFLPMITCIWKISNKNYQEKHWVRQESPMRGDCFDNTTETFEEDAEAILTQKDPCIEMTDKQRKMLDQLLHLVEEYDGDPNTPLSRYGENDAAIVADPRWDKIRQYAKMVYQEIAEGSSDQVSDTKEIKS